LAALPKNPCRNGNADQYNFALTTCAKNGLPSDYSFGEFEYLAIVALVALGAFFTHDNSPHTQTGIGIGDWDWQSDIQTLGADSWWRFAEKPLAVTRLRLFSQLIALVKKNDRQICSMVEPVDSWAENGNWKLVFSSAITSRLR
jgi:hypothetical protein